MDKEVVSEEWLKNLPARAENPAFASDQMIACGKCARSNPPTRVACLYCGAPLKISEARREFLQLNLRPLEAWEKGFNIISLPASENFADSHIEKIAALLKLETQILRSIVERKKPLPLARVETRNEAEIIQRKLRETTRLETAIVADEDLNTQNPPRRLRAMEFSGNKILLMLFNADEIAEIDCADLALIVTGAIFERRIAGVETRDKRGETKLLETNETATDKMLIDIYNRADLNGFRVEQQGFDFSCLGAEKGLLAAGNMRSLVKELARRAPAAKVNEDYNVTRAQIASIWSVEERTDALGLKRDRFAKFNRENVTIVSNAAQFTKYSRLQRQLLK